MLTSRHSDRPVMAFMNDDASRIAAMLGIWKVNRIVIPIAPNSPAKWLTQVIENSGAEQLIVDRSTRSIAELAGTSSISVTEVDQLAPSSERFVAEPTISPDKVALIVYTSGSTGRPGGGKQSSQIDSHERCPKPNTCKVSKSDAMQICAQ